MKVVSEYTQGDFFLDGLCITRLDRDGHFSHRRQSWWRVLCFAVIVFGLLCFYHSQFIDLANVTEPEDALRRIAQHYLPFKFTAKKGLSSLGP